MYNSTCKSGKLFVIFLALTQVSSIFAQEFIFKRDGTSYNLLFTFVDSDGNIGTITNTLTLNRDNLGLNDGSATLQTPGGQISSTVAANLVYIKAGVGEFDIGYNVPQIQFTSPSLYISPAEYPRWTMRLAYDTNFCYVHFANPHQGATRVGGGPRLNGGNCSTCNQNPAKRQVSTQL
jgi:hypothetical protein